MPRTSHHLRTSKGYAFVEIDGSRIYLGRADDPNVQANYHKVLAEFYKPKEPAHVCTFGDITIGKIAAKYLSHCETYYGGKGQYVPECASVKDFIDFHGQTLSAIEYGPQKLRSFQAHLVAKTRKKPDGTRVPALCRGTINARVSSIKRMFKWATSVELIPVAIYTALDTVPALKAGRTEAHDHDAVVSVDDAHIEAIRPHVSRQVWAMVQIQLLTGARPGEIVGLRPRDIDTSNDVWEIRLDTHKTAHKGKSRVLFVGPKGQAILREFMLRGEDDPLFAPTEAVKEKAASYPTHRIWQIKYAPKTDRKVRAAYDVGSYRRAITNACIKAGIPPWHPHQLRHTAATKIERMFGLEAAQVALGHSRADVTQIYVDRDTDKARAVFAQIG